MGFGLRLPHGNTFAVWQSLCRVCDSRHRMTCGHPGPQRRRYRYSVVAGPFVVPMLLLCCSSLCNAFVVSACACVCVCALFTLRFGNTTARGFEPLRAKPNGFLVHHLNHSVTLSCAECTMYCSPSGTRCRVPCPRSIARLLVPAPCLCYRSPTRPFAIAFAIT